MPASGASNSIRSFAKSDDVVGFIARQVCAPLSWTSERVDTLFVDERVRKAAAHSANLASGASQTKPARAAQKKGT
jgi:hypothetical protein